MSMAAAGPTFADAAAVAARFVQARRTAQALTAFPGRIPTDRAAGYACQDAAIELWPDEIAGWKVGRPAPGQEIGFGSARLSGPIFRRAVQISDGVMDAPFIAGGFAAVEAEYVLRLSQDAPGGKTDWSEAEARALVGAMHMGVELAGSPLSLINALGPCVTVSDFGNNAGLILGAEIARWRERSLSDLNCETFIGGKSVGRGGASGGPFEALAWLLGHTARRGRPLKAGHLISTGAATGVHEIEIGQSARMRFDGDGEILCRAVRAAASAQAAR